MTKKDTEKIQAVVDEAIKMIKEVGEAKVGEIVKNHDDSQKAATKTVSNLFAGLREDIKVLNKKVDDVSKRTAASLFMVGIVAAVVIVSFLFNLL